MGIVNEFSDFMLDGNLGNTILATILSTYIAELAISFSENLILPLIDSDDDDKSFKLKDVEVTVNKCKMKIGKFTITFIKVFLMYIIIFIFQKNIGNIRKLFNEEKPN